MGSSSKWLFARGAALGLALAVTALLTACDVPQDPPPYSKGASLQKDVIYATSRRWKKHGLEWLKAGEDKSVALVSEPPAAIGGDTVIFIHGFSAPDTRVATYFGELIEHLQHTVKLQATPLVYDWPSRTQHWTELSAWERMAYQQEGIRNPVLSWEIMQYTGDGGFARSEGVPGLVALLEKLAAEAPQSKIDIVAHSMGTLVVAEAMRREPKAFGIVERIFWLAPDLEYDALEDEEVQKGIAHIETLHVLYSRNDTLLRRISATLHLSGMLGALGPKNPDKIPANVIVHDLTDALGKENVHSRYTTPGTASVDLMVKELGRGE